MKQISRYLLTLALLITAATGAWAAITTEDIGKVICTDGSLYATKILAQNDGKTAAAMIGYVDTENNKALAIALTDGNNNMDWTQASEYCTGLNTSSPVANGTWVLPTEEQWKSVLTLEEVGNYMVYKSESLNTKLNAAKGNALDNESAPYWSATESSGSSYVKCFSFKYGMASVGTVNKTVADGSMTRAFLEIELSDVEVTTNAEEGETTFTEATFNMPAYDATAEYELVRDMQNETNPITFGGITAGAGSSSAMLVVKKGDGGKYQFAEALNITLNDPLASGDDKNIIAAEGITIKVLKGAENQVGAIEYDQENPITLEAFLADPQPGFYWIKAEATADGPYEGVVYSPEMWLIEKYDLAIQPANDFSKDKLDAITIGEQQVNIDTEGKVNTHADAGQEVKLKAKKGYIIEKVEVNKKASAALLSFEVEEQTTIYYLAGETWAQAITNHPTENAKWAVKGDSNVYFDPDGGTNYGVLFIKNGSSVSKDNPIDTSKTYTVEYDD